MMNPQMRMIPPVILKIVTFFSVLLLILFTSMLYFVHLYIYIYIYIYIICLYFCLYLACIRAYHLRVGRL